MQLVGENPDKGGHYITVWAPRQCGKTWTMIEVLWRLMKDDRFHVLKLELEHLKMTEDADEIVEDIADEIIDKINPGSVKVKNMKDFHRVFHRDVLQKPLILILDEFDALAETAISGIAGVFRNIHNFRKKDPNPSGEKEYLLHGVALIGVRSVLGIENEKGSPFNVHRSMRIPNLTFDEVRGMFEWYERESGQAVEPEVVDRLYYETRGQPGLVSWFGELLTEGYDYHKPDPSKPIRIRDFELVYNDGINILPNNTILNIISKAGRDDYRDLVVELFRTNDKIDFRFDDNRMNFLYLNGVIDHEREDGGNYVRFSSSFVQKRLFNYFSNELFPHMGTIFEPFEDVEDTVTETSLNVKNLLGRYERHLRKNREWMLKDAPRRSDMKIREAIFQFNLYEYLVDFFRSYSTRVWPEFPTGNGKVDFIIDHGGKRHALEIKSYRDNPAYRKSLVQAAGYGRRLGLNEIHLVIFVEYIDDANRQKYEKTYEDRDTGVKVEPVFVATGN